MARQGKRARWLVAGVLGLFGALAGTPAQASTPLSIQTIGCIPQGASVMECFVNATGGVLPYAYHWNATTANQDDVTFRCSTAFPATGTASVTVTDSAGAAVSASKGYNCVGGNPK
jgi:hypothetical protein